MRAIIKSTGLISPQYTHNAVGFPEQINEVISDRLSCIEPDYRELINPLLLRRMPRILKMGLAASQICINRAGGIDPDAIIVGTGLGCLDNLEKFLTDMLDNDEHVTTVLPFINSTHNAVASQISMLLKNRNYNTTYCHRGFSFESALLDAIMLINEDKAENVLVGGIDECTNDFIRLHGYLNDWKKPVSNLKLLADRSPGTIAGEGSAFFMLSRNNGSEPGCVSVEGVQTFFTPGGADVEEIESEIDIFLGDCGIKRQELSGVLLGLNGDPVHDRNFHILADGYFSKQTALYYKHLCGEYYTSGAFALWLGSVIPGEFPIPGVLKLRGGFHSTLDNLLIYNQVNNSEHSLIFLKYDSL